MPSVLRSSTVRFGLFTGNGTGATASIYIIATQKMIQQRPGLPKELLTHRFQEGFQTERGGLTNALGSLATSMHISRTSMLCDLQNSFRIPFYHWDLHPSQNKMQWVPRDATESFNSFNICQFLSFFLFQGNTQTACPSWSINQRLQDGKTGLEGDPGEPNDSCFSSQRLLVIKCD